MDTKNQLKHRRNFLRSTGLLGASFLVPNINLACTGTVPIKENIHEFGKREGYTDQISILVSMMDWMRATVLRSVEGMSQKELDFLLDKDSNSIGAMLMHLAATERFYQIDTFTGIDKNSFSFNVDDDEWDAAGNLGDKGRVAFQKKPLNYYLDRLEEVREFSLNELKQRKDNWLMESTPFFGNQPTNNYCKWFHVVEHESNHNGQIKFIRSRVI